MSVIKVTNYVKDLIRATSKVIQVTGEPGSSQPSGSELLVKELSNRLANLDLAVPMYRDLGEYLASFVEMDPECHDDSANGILLDTTKLRDFTIDSVSYNRLTDRVEGYSGKWVVTSEGPYRGKTLSVTRESAYSQLIVSAIVQVLSEARFKTLPKAGELLTLPKRNGALKDFGWISGYLWVIGKRDSKSSKGLAYLRHFAINFKDGYASFGQIYQLQVEDFDRSLSDLANNRNDFEIDDLER